MASGSVRTAINSAVTTAAAPLPVFDLSDFVTLEECLGQIDSQCILIQYVASSERVATIGGEGNQGWEEDGSAVLHYMVPTGFESAPIVTKGDQIRDDLRGTRLTSDITIEALDPFTDFGAGSTGLYGGAWHGWASNLYYVNRTCG
jgi:hypothetical protein